MSTSDETKGGQDGAKDALIDFRRSENEEAYDAFLDGDEEQIRGAILNESLRNISPSEPIICKGDTTVRSAIREIRAQKDHHSAVVVVDDDGRLAGIFTERDVLYRVVGADLDLHTTTLSEVMTPNPVALGPDDRLADALHHMAVRGFRTLPIVCRENRPMGIVFTRHFVTFIVSLFPEEVLNRVVGGAVKHPNAVDGG